MAGATGFEPAISALTGPHVSHYTTPPNNKSLSWVYLSRQEIFISSLAAVKKYYPIQCVFVSPRLFILF